MNISMAKNIELWPIDKLIPYQKNSRTHSEAQVDQIAASIIEFGFTNPILVDSRQGIIAGHGRLEASKKLSLKEVPVIVLDHLSEAQKKAYVIADNKLSDMAGWDIDILAEELHSLKEMGYDLSIAAFTDEELNNLPSDISVEGSYRKKNESTPASASKAVESFLENEYRVMVLCSDENIQADLFEELSKRNGLECKIL
ncbi:MAG: Nucleoid occlusion protein [bacterium ADurb.Bin212]|nr:MAG: Nucleoid occlusion protein [bacterium ADurb.Bin212]